jgi:hypothetical protein
LDKAPDEVLMLCRKAVAKARRPVKNTTRKDPTPLTGLVRVMTSLQKLSKTRISKSYKKNDMEYNVVMLEKEFNHILHIRIPFDNE